MATPLYQYATLAQARQQVANRLYDPGMVFYVPAELTLYIQEALRTFNALAQYWRDEFLFTPTDDVQWYDLTQVPNTLRPYTVEDTDLYTVMEYQLLEPVAGNYPATGTTWTGTGMFTISDLMNAVQRRRDEIYSVTGCAITKTILPLTPNETRTVLADNVIDVRRVAYSPAPVGSAFGGGGFGGGGFGGNNLQAPPNVLYPDDVWGYEAFESNWTTQTPGTPSSYAMSAQPPLSFDVDVPPAVAGQYEVLTVNAGPQLTVGTPTLIGIPDDFAWVLKWGALADLLSKESEAKDAARAAYCNKRYQQGLALLTNAPAALAMRVNNVPVWIDAVRSADMYDTTWQGQPAGVPQRVYVAGLNLIALSPQPDDSNLSIAATVVQNAPIPVADTDFLQCGRDDYDVIIDYAQHLALFKNGGAEFTETIELYARFVRQAATYNSKLSELGEFKDELYGNSHREEMFNPRLSPELAASEREE